MRRTSLALLCLLAACQREPMAGEGGNSRAAPASGLERAAIASGVIADATKVSPIGLFQRSHEAGRDALCVVPDKGGAMRFGLEANFGDEQSCHGRGSARRAGNKLILHFSGGGRCIIVAQYDGDQVALPGVVDLACADLCEGRSSLEGVSFPRIAGDAATALRVRDKGGDALCPS
ncbi:hypothetical protein [Sphingobium sp.]|uniref:hypothetical protein n=1 Tax=Sphingobium sp. TaxID=1912891 RepID=UPI003BB53AEF